MCFVRIIGMYGQLPNAVGRDPFESSAKREAEHQNGMEHVANWLEKYFRDNPGRLIDKWVHYFEIYDRHFSKYRGTAVKVVEIGVYHGGSLQMWKKYFGRRATITGVDIDERVRELTEARIEIVIGDQADRTFLSELALKVGTIDIVIDDGGHTMEQQIVSFEELWPSLSDGGVYLAEDLHTSYWDEFGGGFKREGTFIEYVKNLIDQQHAWHAREGEGLEIDDFTRSIRGIHVYDSIVVIDKGVVSKPYSERTGKPAFPMIDNR